MPTYEYECSACGHSFEELQSMTDPKLTKCPKCGKKKLDRLIGSGSGMIFKGSGFYETDYKKNRPIANKNGPDRKGDQEAPTPKSDSKPADKPAGGCGAGCGCHPS